MLTSPHFYCRNNKEHEELKRDIEGACEKIEDWKAHIVRMINQDDAKSSVLENLTGKEVLIIIDWAMKCLPVKFRETQSEWFGKKGISWHVSACITKPLVCAPVSEQFEVQFRKFVLIFEMFCFLLPFVLRHLAP